MNPDQIKTMLVEVLTDVTGNTYPPLTDEQNLREQLQLDSLDMVSMAIEVQARLGVAIDPEEVTSIVTVGDLVALLSKKSAAAAPNRAA
jgi:acyl carrier protein